ncbi:hypothetical protein [Methanoregula sp.]|uniref:hypothetical protein n=1 Tax=Methanoregula sp. TaxID=2052170 RepID=UPI000CCB5B48|nr:hypothetical protein [Methanoregula sp.]PKG33069.1 MAG: hypothetical protein CW742_04845 [Methanoregula sp.]
MSSGWSAAGIGVLIILVLASSGCTTARIGEVTVTEGDLLIDVNNRGAPSDAFVQVTVYEVRDLHQQERLVIQQPATLQTGENSILVPAGLPPGTYKLYIYILSPAERTTATIRDINV